MPRRPSAPGRRRAQGRSDGLAAQFGALEDVEVDAAGRVYVVDGSNHRIQVFSNDGTFLGKFGKNGGAVGEVSWPMGVAVGGGTVFVADAGNHRVQAFPASPSGIPSTCSPDLGHFFKNKGPMMTEGVVLSGSRRKVYVIGGTVEGTDNGVPNGSAWQLDVDTNAWQETPIAEAERPGAVLAITYLADDRAVYLVDRIGAATRLRRWKPGQASVEVLATLPVPWQTYERAWLAAGTQGDLTFAASRSQGGGAQASVLARFTVDDAGALSFEGMTYLDVRMLAEPVVGLTEAQITVPDPSGARVAAVALSSFGGGPPGQLPVLE